MIKINNLKKLYGDRTVLDIKSLKIKKGECVVLTGHNGSGKSTLMNIITDNLKTDSGEILFDGENVKKMGVHFREKCCGSSVFWACFLFSKAIV